MYSLMISHAEGGGGGGDWEREREGGGEKWREGERLKD